MAKKWSVVRDDLNIKGGGLYCILPFSNIDEKGKAAYKVGATLDFNKRFESYHTSFPQGFYVVCIIERPPIPHRLRGKITGKRASYYKSLEALLIERIEKMGGERIRSNARVRGSDIDKDLGGRTEWFYTSYNTIFAAFQDVQRESVKVADENNEGKAKRRRSQVNNFHSFNTSNVNAITRRTIANAKYVGQIVFM